MKKVTVIFVLLLFGLSVTGANSKGKSVQASPPGHTVYFPIITHEFNNVQPSKIAYIIQQRVDQVAAAMGSANPNGSLPPNVVDYLSDNLIMVNALGEMRLTFHGRQAITPAQLADLEALGGNVEISTADMVWPLGMPPGLGVAVAWLPYDQVMATEQLDWLAAVTTTEDQPPDEGNFLSEGVALHNADILDSLGIDGTGITIGAISDGVTNMAVAQATGDLPATVTIPGGCTSGVQDEGTAMLEIIHDMAPGSALMFCGTGNNLLTHLVAQNSLVAAGVDIIAEDIAFDTEPAFQQGIAAFNGDTIAGAGVSMHSSAGNRGAQHTARITATGTGGGPDGNAGPFAGCPLTPDNVVAIAGGGDTTFDIQVQPGPNGTTMRFTLQWSEPRAIFPTSGAGGFTDLNLYVMNGAATTCLASSVGVQGNGFGDTMEQISMVFPPGSPNVNLKLVVDVQGVNGAVATPLLDLRWRGRAANTDTPTRNGSLNPDSNYTGLATSSASADASVSTNPNTIMLENSSSGGPVQLWSTTVCPGGTYPCPGTSVAGPPMTTANAPTWTGADGVSISGAGGFGRGTCPATNQGDCRFFGTSAAAPHAAACDALVRQALGGGATVNAVNTRLITSAVDRGTPGFDTAWGFGVLDCIGAAIQGDLSLTKSDSPDPVAAGAQLTYQLDVTNNGPDDVPNVVITDTLPAGVAFNSSPDGCVETGPGSGILTCTVASLANSVTASFDVVVDVDADLVYNNGGPVTITNFATVFGLGFDPDPTNNDDSEDTLVVAEADLEIVDFTVVGPPAEVLIGETVTLTFTKLVRNNGPSAPIDAELTLDAVAPAGSTVTPTMSTIQVLTMELNDLRLVTETFTINCGQPGQQTFTFNNEIQPLNPADTDPDQSNNTASVDVSVECVVPVAINIKPGSFPNSINVRNRGVIPLAILTTIAGEYDLPLDFDATTVDPLSVRFGQRDPVWTETGGAFETHNRGHLEDSYELDESTRDGDIDMVLHFRTQETGLVDGDIEACVKGEFVDGGNTYKFFGCDSVRTVPEQPPTADSLIAINDKEAWLGREKWR